MVISKKLFIRFNKQYNNYKKYWVKGDTKFNINYNSEMYKQDIH